MTAAIAAILVLYGAFAGVGWIAAKKARGGTAADLLVAGRQMPLLLAALTMTATWVDGGYLLGTAEATYKSSIQLGVQGGVCFGLSLIFGGVFFAGIMRRHGFTTLIDLFEVRFGTRWAAVLFLPALAGELFWSAELLVAIGSTFGVLLGASLTFAIVAAAVVTIGYTMVGGMWSVAYTDAIQLGLVALGLAVALPFALEGAGGLTAAWAHYETARSEGSTIVPPLGGAAAWPLPAVVSWWDVTLMLICGGIPWNCYFQRVLSCRTPRAAQAHSVVAGALTIAFTVPPLLMGVAAFGFPWSPDAAARLEQHPAETLPLVLARAVPPLIGVLGLAAIVSAVTSSFSSSILSAGSMLSWNGVRALAWPSIPVVQMKRAVRLSILLFGGAATALALKVRSVQALWFFTSDLVFVLLFPQLVFALFDRKVNRIGSVTAFAVALVLRLGGGEPLLGLRSFIPYPEIFAAWLPGAPAEWYDAHGGTMLFPFKATAAATGIVLLPIVSRLTARWDAPRPL